MDPAKPKSALGPDQPISSEPPAPKRRKIIDDDDDNKEVQPVSSSAVPATPMDSLVRASTSSSSPQTAAVKKTTSTKPGKQKVYTFYDALFAGRSISAVANTTPTATATTTTPTVPVVAEKTAVSKEEREIPPQTREMTPLAVPVVPNEVATTVSSSSSSSSEPREFRWFSAAMDKCLGDLTSHLATFRKEMLTAYESRLQDPQKRLQIAGELREVTPKIDALCSTFRNDLEAIVEAQSASKE